MQVCSRVISCGGFSLIGDVETWLDRYAALEAEDCFRTALFKSRAADREAGRALIGPHRSDIAVTHLLKTNPLPFVRR